MITLEDAERVVSGARAKAEQLGQPVDIAVVDAGRELKAFVRMDGALLGSIDVAIGKAFTAASFQLATRDLAPIAQPGEPLFGIHATNGGRIVIFPGGIPLEQDGEVVGAVGVSSGTVEQDQAVAEAGVAAF